MLLDEYFMRGSGNVMYLASINSVLYADNFVCHGFGCRLHASTHTRKIGRRGDGTNDGGSTCIWVNIGTIRRHDSSRYKCCV